MARITETRASLSSTFAPADRAALGGLWAFLGDSITVGTAATSPGGYALACGFLSKQRIRMHARVATAGYRSDQMAPAVAASIIPSGADTCFILLGANDAGQDVTRATFATNVAGIVTELREAGIQPVIGSVPPRSDKRSLVGQYNAWLRVWCAANGISLVEIHGALVDPATGGLATAYDSGDGVHPNLAGHMVIAQTIVDACAELTPAGSAPLCTENGDPTNLFANGLFLTDANVDGVGDSWINSSGTVVPTYSLVADAARWLGNAQKLAFSALNGYRRISQPVTTGFTPGDTLGWGFVFALENVSGAVNGLKVDRVYTGGAGATVSTFSAFNVALNRGVFWQTFVVPDGATQISARFVAQTDGGSCDFLMAQATLLNLTTLGVA